MTLRNKAHNWQAGVAGLDDTGASPLLTWRVARLLGPFLLPCYGRGGRFSPSMCTPRLCTHLNLKICSMLLHHRQKGCVCRCLCVYHASYLWYVSPSVGDQGFNLLFLPAFLMMRQKFRCAVGCGTGSQLLPAPGARRTRSRLDGSGTVAP